MWFILYIYIEREILLRHRKNEIMPIVTTWMEPEIIIRSEVNQSEKDKYHKILLIWGI